MKNKILFIAVIVCLSSCSGSKFSILQHEFSYRNKSGQRLILEDYHTQKKFKKLKPI